VITKLPSSTWSGANLLRATQEAAVSRVRTSVRIGSPWRTFSPTAISPSRRALDGEDIDFTGIAVPKDVQARSSAWSRRASSEAPTSG